MSFHGKVIYNPSGKAGEYPVIDFESSYEMLVKCEPYCDFFKIGLLSGSHHHFELVREFLDEVFELIPVDQIVRM